MGLDIIKENMEDSYKIKLVNRLNDILSNISTMEDIVKRLGIMTSIIDDFRELVNIDAEILKSALIENDTILNKADWSNIIKGGLLYPEYPCSMVNHKNTIVDFIVHVITVDVSEEV